ncbi:hypothetical protein T439DRAFT_381540 [Meredithblackwellia eburnea MCA 4105]
MIVQSWLQTLSNHPIFTLPASTSSAQPALSTHPSLSELARPPSPALSSIFGPSKTASQDEKSTGKKTRMVIARGTDLIVAVGSELRIASLAECKTRFEQPGQVTEELAEGEYKLLETPLIDYEIHHLVLNPTSKLLAVVGVHTVTVVVLPSKTWVTSIGKALPCRSLQVGRYYHSLPGSPSISSALFHPYSPTSSSLLLLTSDGNLREYDISQDASEPLQTLSFGAPRGRKGGFSAYDEEEGRAVGLALGEGRGWEALTVFVLLGNGDLKAACPFLPSKFVLPPTFSVPQADPTNPYQLRFLSSLLSTSLTNPARLTPPLVQGPLPMSPAPVTDEEEDDVRAVDLVHLSFNETGVLAIAYENGKVDLCFTDGGVEPLFVGEETGGESAGVGVFETIDLGLERRREEGVRPSFVKDPLYEDVVYLFHEEGAHCLVLEGWVGELAAAQEGGEEKVEKLLKEAKGSEVVWILKSDTTGSETEGLVVVNDVYLGYSMLVMTAQLQVVGIELSLRVDGISSTGSTSNLLVRTPQGGNQDPLSQPATLLAQPFTIPPLLSSRSTISSSVPRLAPHPSSKPNQPLQINPTTLRSFGQTVLSFRGEIRNLVDAADAVQHRLELQMKELARQLGQLAELSAMGGGIGGSGGKSSTTELERRMNEVKGRQEELVRRTDRVLQKLMESHQPELSSHEKKWFEELGRVEKEVKGERGLEGRVKRVEAKQSELEPVLRELKAREGKANGTPTLVGERKGLGAEQKKAVEGKLAEEARLIADARRKVDRLSRAVAAVTLEST